MSELRAEWFRPVAIAAETAEFYRERALANAGAAHGTTVPIEERRAGFERLFGPRKSDNAVERTLGGVPARILRSERVDGVLLWLHGGGWALGTPWYADDQLWEFAEASNIASVSIDYRLAPEDPYPAAPDDCEAAALWLVKHAMAEFGTERLLIGGASAGAHLAAVTLQRLRDRHGYTAFLGADLLYGLYDLAGTPWMRTVGESLPVLDWRLVQQFVEYFAPNRDLRDPDVSPIHGDLRSMPPALFSVGTRDSLLEDSLFMHARWLAAGNDAELAVYPGGAHIFDLQPLSIARASTERRHEFLRRRLGIAVPS